MPTWYKNADQWLLSNGWPILLLAAAIVIGVTMYLVVTQNAAALALWLTYLFMP